MASLLEPVGPWCAGALSSHTLTDAVFALPALALAGSLLYSAFGLARAAHRVRGLVRDTAIGTGPGGSVVLSDGALLVAVAGLRRPQVVVSAGALVELDEAELRAGLDHERGHIALRHRYLLVAGELARAVGRFLPGTNAAARELTFALERHADSYALSRRHEPAVLASAICKAARGALQAPALSLGRWRRRPPRPAAPGSRPRGQAAAAASRPRRARAGDGRAGRRRGARAPLRRPRRLPREAPPRHAAHVPRVRRHVGTTPWSNGATQHPTLRRNMPSRTMAIAEAQIAQRLERARVIALAAPDTPALAEHAGAALVRGGITCIELAHPDATLIRAARRVDELLVGAGDVRTVGQAELALRAGAHFATSPVTNTEVIWACRELELPFLPGAATPSEVERLALLGVNTIRVFPAMPLGGAAFVQALAAVCPEIRFVPAGGIGPEALRPFLALPSVAAVGAASLAGPDLLQTRNYDRIEWMAREAVRALSRR